MSLLLIADRRASEPCPRSGVDLHRLNELGSKQLEITKPSQSEGGGCRGVGPRRSDPPLQEHGCQGGASVHPERRQRSHKGLVAPNWKLGGSNLEVQGCAWACPCQCRGYMRQAKECTSQACNDLHGVWFNPAPSGNHWMILRVGSGESGFGENAQISVSPCSYWSSPPVVAFCWLRRTAGIHLTNTCESNDSG